MSPNQNQLGLALSGGGYRAAAFHLGTLNKLDELQLLDRVDQLSTISGGSITGAAWSLDAATTPYPEFHKQMIHRLRSGNLILRLMLQPVFFVPALFILAAFSLLVAGPWLHRPWLALIPFPIVLFIFFRYQFQWFPFSKGITKAYNDVFYNGRTLAQLATKPELVIGSSNLQTGRPFTFTRTRISDSAYGDAEYEPKVQFEPASFPVAAAVMASSCVPFAFSPVLIANRYRSDGGANKKVKPVLVDGGVYDNQGLHKLSDPRSSHYCTTIIVSDAGGSFRGNKIYRNTIGLVLRSFDLFMYRIKAVQMMNTIYREGQGPRQPIAYFSLGWRLSGLIPGFVRNMKAGQVPAWLMDAHALLPEWQKDPGRFGAAIEWRLQESIGYTAIAAKDLSDEEWKQARNVGTNLTPISSRLIGLLIRQAENLTEAQVKLYCPHLLHPQIQPA